MPKKSLASSPTPIEQRFKCIGPCKKIFAKQRSNFPTVQSTLYAGNNYYLPWCNKCIDFFYTRYREECGLSEADTIKRLCSKFDIYWSTSIYNTMPSAVSATQSRMRTYISRTNLTQYSGKTYDDTISEEAEAALALEKELEDTAKSEQIEPTVKEEDIDVPQNLIEFWGAGRSPSVYFDLQRRYDKLTKGCTVDTPATEMLVKQACLSEYEIDLLQKEGKPFEKQQSSLVNTLGSLNLKPSQIKEAEKNSGLDTMPFGVGIQRWETTRPIPQPDDDWKDVDNIARYVLTWYTGGSMRMLGEDNQYTNLFNAALDKYKVARPDLEDASDFEAISDILESGDNDAG